MKIAGTTIVLLLLAIGAYIGHGKYQDYTFLEAVRPLVKNSSLRLQNGLSYETDSDRGITYKELFNKLEENISEIDKNILQVQTLSTPRQKKVIEPIEAYLQCTQELQRALLSKYRARLKEDTAMEVLRSSMKSLQAAGIDNFHIYEKTVIEAIDDAKKTQTDKLEAIAGLVATARKMKEIASVASSGAAGDSVIDTRVIDAFVKKNETEERELREALKDLKPTPSIQSSKHLNR